jgi:uncharacterized protein
MSESQPPQDEVLALLGSASAYRPQPDRVKRIDTHASVVFLAGEDAFKVKRAVRYPFLDFSTLEKRRLACLNELALNRRTAPAIYLGVEPIVRDAGGKLRIGGEGEIVEWTVRMRRFDDERLYDRLAERGALPLEAMDALAREIAAFHDAADRKLAPTYAHVWLERVIAENETAFAADPALFAPDAAAALTKASRDAFGTFAVLLTKRAHGGFVRHCHGDLHLRNIVDIEGRPVLFDAIEFDDQIATVDVLNDLAFLLMDLGARGLGVPANRVLNAYLEAEGSTGNLVGLALLPLFLSLRAGIRAKVEALRARQGPETARAEAEASALHYFSLAQAYLTPPPARLVAIGGLSGSGKSTVARALAPELGAFPGAVHVRSDIMRKRMFGVPAEARLPVSAYAPKISDMVYTACRKNALSALEAGHSAIVDAVHARADEREAIEGIAARVGVPFRGLWLQAGKDVLIERVGGRSGDASDADADVVESQSSYELGRIDWRVIDASGSLDETLRACRRALGLSG